VQQILLISMHLHRRIVSLVRGQPIFAASGFSGISFAREVLPGPLPHQNEKRLMETLSSCFPGAAMPLIG